MPRARRLSLATLSLTVALGCRTTPPAEQVVLAPEAPAAPYVPPPPSAPTGQVEAPRAQATAQPTPGPEPAPFRESVRDPRPYLLRPVALVQTEIQGLENLLGGTPPSAPGALPLTRRLAEDNAELARSGGGTISLNAARQAIHYYTLLQRNYPGYPQADEVGYFLGYEYERLGDAANARRAYFEIIQKYPASRYVPYAYFAFGEMFLAEAASDPSKWDLALQSFAKVAQFQSKLVPEAILRLGNIHARKGEKAEAAREYQRLRQDYPDSHAATRTPSY